MEYRQVTPPSTIDVEDYDALQRISGSASSRASLYSNGWSPASIMTAATTPPKSPQQYPFTDSSRRPILVREVRPDDRAADPFLAPPTNTYSHHSRAISLPPADAYSSPFGGMLPAKPTSSQRRSISPYTDSYVVPPPYGCIRVPDTELRRSPSSGSRAPSASNAYPTHSRSVSSSSIDASKLSRYGYPTYRQSPAPRAVDYITSTQRPASAMSHLAPISLSRGNIQARPVQQRRTVSPAAKPHRLSTEYSFPDERDMLTSTALDYLTSPNPRPSLVERPSDSNKHLNTHFWFDIRNVRPWADFNVDTIVGIPGLLQLLRIAVPAKQLPEPGIVNLNPETPMQLAEMCSRYHAVKVNSALRLAQGNLHMAMRTLNSPPGTRQQPEFVANYHSDSEKTIFGDGRGRVVGIVKCHDEWRSSWRSGGPNDRVRYLRHLAHLHRFMREHGTRYGFIMTERELVCVRAGGPPTPDNVPLFGYIEVAPSVRVSTAADDALGGGGDGRSSLVMTVDLALWYLHMLAKEQPFPGQFHWRLDVGAPAALTRRHHEPRDDGMSKPTIAEKREAKRVRGWLWPDEPLSRRECGRGRRTRS